MSGRPWILDVSPQWLLIAGGALFITAGVLIRIEPVATLFFAFVAGGAIEAAFRNAHAKEETS